MYIKETWCTNSRMVASICDSNIEILAVQCRPFYLPREFTCVTLVAVYCCPTANTTEAHRQLVAVVEEAERKHPDSVILVGGDFNQLHLNLRTYFQMVDCPTRGNNTLDKLYCNISKSYITRKLPPLGLSDHCLLHLVPKYVQKSRRSKPTTFTRLVWSREACNNLIASLELTDWSVFHDECLDTFVDSVVGYINFCVETTVPCKTVKIYPNNKPWICREVAEAIKQRRMAMHHCTREELRRRKADVRREIRKAKNHYARNIESNLNTNQPATAWKCLQDLLELRKSSNTLDCDLNELNDFFTRFDNPAHAEPDIGSQEIISCSRVLFDTEDVQLALRRLNKRKPPGPDDLHPRVLAIAAQPLAPVIKQLFEQSMHTRQVPASWKLSKIKPIPKNQKKSLTPSDFRPIALTSALVKVMERFILNHLRDTTECDDSQFAYRAHRGTSDAILCLTDTLITHMERKCGNYTRCLFVDFSSAFNTLVPDKLVAIIRSKEADPDVADWVSSFLQGRRQYTTDGVSSSTIKTTCTGTPQGSVISPYLFTEYISDIQTGSPRTGIVKYADDLVIYALCEKDGTGEDDYRHAIQMCTEAFNDLELILNTAKTKEMVISTGRSRPNVDSLLIDGAVIEKVQKYKYLGTVLTENMEFDANWLTRIKKARQRLYMLRKLRYCGASATIMKLTFSAYIRPVLTYHLSLFYDHLSQKILQMIKRIWKTAKHITKTPLPEILDVRERKGLFYKIYIDDDHPFSRKTTKLPSGRIQLQRYRTNTGKKCFRSILTRTINSEVFKR